jgi:hypothetical protein
MVDAAIVLSHESGALDERCSSHRSVPVQVYNMLVTQFTTRTATSTYTTPPGGPGAIALASAAGLDLLGARMGFDVATQTYTWGCSSTGVYSARDLTRCAAQRDHHGLRSRSHPSAHTSHLAVTRWWTCTATASTARRRTRPSRCLPALSSTSTTSQSRRSGGAAAANQKAPRA